MQKGSTKIMQEYEQQCVLYSDLTEKIEKLIRDFLKEKGIKVHSILSRLKNSDSLKKKVNRSERNYSNMSDVTDISGIRVITYFADDVDAVAKVIEEEFDIDRDNSVDKSALLDPDRFGYISLHYVAKLSNSRMQLTEYRKFSDCVVEIQVRSILQHTWAEIEHDLGYKSKESVPKDIRRRFSRLAGLLEIADSEFIQIRDSLQEYEKAVPEIIIENPASVLINQASLQAFIRNSTLVRELDQRIASNVKAKIVGEMDILNELKYVGFETIADIESPLRKFGDIAVGLSEKWLEGEEVLQAGISLFYLCYILVAHDGSVEKVLEYIETFNLRDENLDIPMESIADDVISYYKDVISNIKS